MMVYSVAEISIFPCVCVYLIYHLLRNPSMIVDCSLFPLSSDSICFLSFETVSSRLVAFTLGNIVLPDGLTLCVYEISHFFFCNISHFVGC